MSSAGFRSWSRVLLIGVSLASMASHASDAENPEPELKATPYRPTTSNPAALPVPGHLEWEAGGLSTRGPGDDRRISMPFLLKYAFNDDFGVLVGGDGLVSEQNAGESYSGSGDTSLALKVHHALAKATAVALEASVKLPTASRQLGSGHADFTLNGIVSTELGECAVDINLNYTRLGVASAAETRNVVGWALAASRPISTRWGVVGELSGVRQRGAPHQVTFLGGASYNVRPTIVVDAGALAGLDHAAARFGAFLGMTVIL
jgi:hypothetical protein